jgi:hypothetical protein
VRNSAPLKLKIATLRFCALTKKRLTRRYEKPSVEHTRRLRNERY